jgi:hypothetical protein
MFPNNEVFIYNTAVVNLEHFFLGKNHFFKFYGSERSDTGKLIAHV